VPTQTNFSENELLGQVTASNEAAFRQLYDGQHQRIYAFAFFLTRSDTLAEEVTQEIFIKVWTHREELSGIRHFDAWLKTLVRNQAFSYLKRLAKERLILQEISQRTQNESYSTESEVLDKEYSRLLKQAIEQLPPQQKKVYLLSRQEGLKQEKIADSLGISVNTVKNHMKSALRNIKLFLDGRTDALIALALALVFYE
jgi:RNA polymerase sigma-70 factor (family 1)